MVVDGIRTLWHAVKAMQKAVKAANSTMFKVWRGEMTAFKNAEFVRNSEFFDAEWYLKNNPDVKAAGMDPARHYAIYGHLGNRNPSVNFVTEEYYALHNDVRASKMNPLVHYERFGKREGRIISFAEVKEPVFPEGCIETERMFARVPRQHGRTAVVASYFGGGQVPATLIYLLRGLREVVDNIVCVTDCPVLPEEISKFEGLVTVVRFERHRQYDFGSYRRGLEIARREGLLDADIADELVVINDSNYGPVFPFGESFTEMSGRPCDFWGYTGYNFFGIRHISSYFYVFRRRVIEAKAFWDFFAGVQGILPRDLVIVKYELKLTKALQYAGLRYDTFVPMDAVKGSPAKCPVTMLKRFHDPLLKAKVVNGDSVEDVDEALKFVAKVNPELASIIVPHPIKTNHLRLSYAEHQASFPARCERIAEKVRAGGRIRTVFFVSTASMFPLRALFECMLRKEMFDPVVYVIPDTRWGMKQIEESMDVCYEELAKICPPDRLFRAERDEFGLWQDVLEGADIVAYPSPYELSSFRYNPHYAIGRDFLPILANYGFYRSVYDREVMGNQCYAYMWKAFFECEQTLAEYRTHSVIGGTNVDLVGYMKMDDLALVRPEPHARKRILIAPHHSVEGGTNKMLSLANFIRYADFFMELPDRYPEIDFVFRPHPFLFKVMSRPQIWGPRQVEEYIAALRAKPNLIWSDGGDYFREFAESDGCIQDCGSYLVEYFYVGKPCCYMLKSPEDIDTKFAPLGKDCLSHCYLAYDTAAIDAFIRTVIVEGQDPQAEARVEFAKTVMVNYPHAADVALDHICQAIGIKSLVKSSGGPQ